MIQHIVLFRAKDGTPPDIQQEACKRLESLVGKIEGLSSLEAGLDIGTPSNFDFGLVAELDDEDALHRFNADAAHLEVAYWIADFREDLVVIDIVRQPPALG